MSYFDTPNNIMHNTWFSWFLSSPRVRTLILNRGAHFVDDDTLLRNLYDTLLAVTRARPEVVVVYRSTPYGHSDCGTHQHDKPLKANEPIFTDASTVKYHWDSFSRQNAITRKLISSFFPSVFFFDIAGLTNLRIDSHYASYDCLHYCIPGPLDSWLELFIWGFQAIKDSGLRSLVHSV